jgi:hypothetical protein
MMMIHLEPARTQKTAHSDARRQFSGGQVYFIGRAASP